MAYAEKYKPYAERYLPDDPFLTMVVVMAVFAVGTILKGLFLVAPVGLLLMRFLAKAIKRATRSSLDVMAELYRQLSENFFGIVAVKAYTMEAQGRTRYHEVVGRFIRLRQTLAFYMALTHPIAEIMAMGVVSASLLMGAYLVLNRETHLLGIKISDAPLSPAALMVFYGLIAGVADPARKMTGLFGTIYGGTAAAGRICRMMDREPMITDPPHPKPVPRPHRELVFENIRFAYQPKEPVLKGIHLRIAHGEKIALVGPNGCGKSTLAKLVPRFYDSNHGVVRMDGIDLREFGLHDLRRQISLVTQETWMFDDTILNNIRYGNPGRVG